MINNQVSYLLDDLPVLKSSLKYDFLKKGKKIMNRFDDMKNIATNKLEDWIEEDEDIIQNQEIKQKSFYTKNDKSTFFKNKKEDEPWI